MTSHEKAPETRPRKYRAAAAPAGHHADAPAHGDRARAVYETRASRRRPDTFAGQLALRRDLEGDGLQHAQAVRGKAADTGAGRQPEQDRVRPQYRAAPSSLRCRER